MMRLTTVTCMALTLALTFIAGCCVDPPLPPKPAAPPKIDKLAEGQRAVLFNGKDLTGWTVVKDDIFYNATGKVYVKDGSIILEDGKELTGIVWAGKPLRDNYRITLQGKRVEGSDFFCGLTFPIRKGHATLILGGWGGSVVGISNIDDMTAVDGPTTQSIEFKQNRWYDIEVEVAENQITVALDDKVIIEHEIGDHRFDVWPQMEPLRPLGLATYLTKGAIRNIVVNRLWAERKQEQTPDR